MIKKLFNIFSLIVICIILIYSLYSSLMKYFFKSHSVINPQILNLKNNIFDKKDLSKEKIVVLVSHYNENLFWLKKIKYPFIISSKVEKNKTQYVSVNKGNEALAYLDYIVKFYDVLPEYTFFSHGHYIDWHQKTPIDKIINRTKIDRPYININDMGFDDRCDKCENVYFDEVKLLWNELFLETLGPIAPKYYDKCCAQFIVHRDRIKLRSKQFYQKLIEYTINKDNGKIGYVLEYLWHNIFGENPVMEYKNKFLINRINFY